MSTRVHIQSELKPDWVYYQDFAKATAQVLQDMLEGYDDNVRPSRQRLAYLIDWAHGRRWAKEDD